MNKINLYIFSQIIKSCTLVFFIFVSIAWLMQLSRLFNVMSHLQINSLEILYLSLLIVPNLINTVLPFLIIFGFVLTFLKLSKDKEIIAMYSSGISISEIKKPIFLIVITAIILSFFLSYFVSPIVYDLYKKKEFNLRNIIEFDKIDFSNFIKFSKNIIIDFENNDGEFQNILININDVNEVIIYSKSGQIEQTDKKINFTLIDGFKTEIKKNNIENLKFDTYLASFPLDEKKIYIKSDPNALGLFELLQEENRNHRIIIYQRLIDSLLIISLCIFFYFNIIKKNNYSLTNQLLFILISIICLLIDNLFEAYIYILLLNILIIHIYPVLFNFVRNKNEI